MDNNTDGIELRNLSNIRYIHGDLFTSDADCLVNAVNVVGVMGGGIAAEFKRRYPAAFETYKSACTNAELKTGQVMFYTGEGTNGKVICMFPTKSHWKYPSRVEYIESGLRAFVEFHRHWPIKSAAFPKLGCGLGGLDWEYEVKPLMERYLSGLDIEIQIYV